MELLLSKKEIEIINEEHKDVSNIYIHKENTLVQLFTIKIYNLMKIDYEFASSYIDKILKISSICEDVDLNYYRLKDVQVFFTLKNNILYGYIIDLNDVNEPFINVAKIKNDLILLNKKLDLKSSLIEEMLTLNNIICINHFSSKLREELKNEFLQSIKDRFMYNIFKEMQFRKDEFLNRPIANKEAHQLLKHYYWNVELEGLSIEESIIEKFIIPIQQKTICSINNLLKELRDTLSINITNKNYLNNEINFSMDKIIMNYLYTPIPMSNLNQRNLYILDLFFIKDFINDFFNNKNLIQNKKIFNKIENLEYIYSKLYSEIIDYCDLKKYPYFNVNVNNRIIIRDCNYYFITKRPIRIDGFSYSVPQLCIKDSLGRKCLLGKPLDIDMILNLRISYEGKDIYIISDEIKKTLIETKNEIDDIITKNKLFKKQIY